MSIKLRFALLLGLLLLAFTLCLIVLRGLEKRQLAEAIANSRRDDSGLMVRWLELSGNALRQFTLDYAQWDEMARFVETPDAEWAAVNIDASLDNFGLHAVWVLRVDGSLIYSVRARSATSSDPLPPPASPEAWLELTRGDPLPNFFHATADGLLEIRAAPVVFSNQTVGDAPPRGWLLAARVWDDDHLSMLAQLVEGHTQILAPDEAPPRGDNETRFVFLRPLADLDGNTLATLAITRELPELAQRLQADAFKARIFVAFGFFLIVALALCLHLWILRPLGWISESLATHTTHPIQPLFKERTELTRVALLIESSFAQREALRREAEERTLAEDALRRTLEERARLGRDLHDSVIQSIYAAGMGLAAARALATTNPAESNSRIDQVRDALNETIRDVRNFIMGLEPEALQSSTFTRAVEQLFAIMRTARPVGSRIEIDEALIDRLPLLVRTEALQIIREAVSNSVRHGRANNVTVTLRAVEGGARLEVSDDGTGFDPERARRGRGLDNIAERARTLGATAETRSSPGKGTRTVVTFAHNAAQT